MKRFRKILNTYTFDELRNEDNDFGFNNSDYFISGNEIDKVLDSIENEVNMIKDKLKAIKGLTEIDEIYDVVKELSEKLY